MKNSPRCDLRKVQFLWATPRLAQLTLTDLSFVSSSYFCWLFIYWTSRLKVIHHTPNKPLGRRIIATVNNFIIYTWCWTLNPSVVIWQTNSINYSQFERCSFYSTVTVIFRKPLLKDHIYLYLDLGFWKFEILVSLAQNYLL